MTYTGRRHSTGTAMPLGLRIETIGHFLNPIVWAFGCRAEKSRSQARLKIGTMLTNVEFSWLVYRTPMDRNRIRAGFLEGPVMLVQCRQETRFGTASKDTMDVLREVGGLLALAQERAREGQTEHVPGEGQWWTEKPRWGGGTGEPIGTPLEDEEAANLKAEEHKTAPPADVGDGERASKRRNTPKRGWRTEISRQISKKMMLADSHKPPKANWDRRTDYQRVGTPKKQGHDDVSFTLDDESRLSLLVFMLRPPSSSSSSQCPAV